MATGKQVATEEVSSTPKAVATQKVEAIPLTGYQPHPGTGKTGGFMSKQALGKYLSKSQTSNRPKHGARRQSILHHEKIM